MNINTEYTEVERFLLEQGDHTLAHLVLLQDKELIWAQERSVLIAYKRIGSQLYVLGDPIGPEERIGPALREFTAYARRLRAKPVFYQVHARYLPYYEDSGFSRFKLGEEALVDLNGFSLAGKKWSKLRTRKNKFERNGCRLQVEMPPFSGSFLSELEAVSEAWLRGRHEKSFSVGFYSREYVSRYPVAVLYDQEGEITAFATLAGAKSQDQDPQGTIVIDLMRYRPSSPHGTMDMLFLSIFEWAAAQGYARCSLGMAPLSGVGTQAEAGWCEQLARRIYEHGGFLYKFKGLCEFKDKFHPEWEPRYLVYPGKRLPVYVLHLIYLIHFGRRPLLPVRRRTSLYPAREMSS